VLQPVMMDDGIFGILVVEANPHFSRRDMQLLNVHYLLLLNVFFSLSDMLLCGRLIKLLLMIDLLCLTPLSAIFQLYHGDQF
jgi:hypothetical protein